MDNIHWYRQRNTTETVATHVNGTFVPTQPFVNFVGAEGNSGLVLNKVQQSDSGNYSVVVRVYDASRLLANLTRSVYVQIDGKCHGHPYAFPYLL